MSGKPANEKYQEAASDDDLADAKFDAIVDDESLDVGSLDEGPLEDEAGEATSDLEQELAAEKDRVLRLQAEMENLRNRTSREIADTRRYAAVPLIRDLLPVVDNTDRAIDAAQQAEDAGSLLEGFKLVKQQLLTVLEQHHCKPIEALGEPFDPQIHDAILQQPSAEVPANHVAMVTQVGYTLHDRVVRPAQVIISTGPPPG